MHRFTLTVAVLLCATGNTAFAHPSHSTLAEMEWNPRSGVFEVSLQFAGIEIEEELLSLHGRRISLESTPGAEQLLRDYVEQRFRISDATRRSSRIRWVGMEVQVRYVWAYFEIELTENAEHASAATVQEDASGFDELRVHCTLLTTFRPEQVNLVNLKSEDKFGSVHLTRDQPEARIEMFSSEQRFRRACPSRATP